MCNAKGWNDKGAQGVNSLNNNLVKYESFLRKLQPKISGIERSQNESMDDDLIDSTAPWQDLPSSCFHRHFLQPEESVQTLLRPVAAYEKTSGTKYMVPEQGICTPEQERVVINVTARSPQRRIIFPSFYPCGQLDDFGTAISTKNCGDKTISPPNMDDDETCTKHHSDVPKMLQDAVDVSLENLSVHVRSMHLKPSVNNAEAGLSLALKDDSPIEHGEIAHSCGIRDDYKQPKDGINFSSRPVLPCIHTSTWGKFASSQSIPHLMNKELKPGTIPTTQYSRTPILGSSSVHPESAPISSSSPNVVRRIFHHDSARLSPYMSKEPVQRPHDRDELVHLLPQAAVGDFVVQKSHDTEKLQLSKPKSILRASGRFQFTTTPCPPMNPPSTVAESLIDSKEVPSSNRTGSANDINSKRIVQSTYRKTPYSKLNRISRISFNPCIWIREFARSDDELRSTWYTSIELQAFKQEAIECIIRYHRKRRIPIRSGQTSAHLGGLSLLSPRLCKTSSGVTFSHRALKHDDDEDEPDACIVYKQQEHSNIIESEEISAVAPCLAPADTIIQKSSSLNHRIQSYPTGSRNKMCLQLCAKSYSKFFPITFIRVCARNVEAIETVKNEQSCVPFTDDKITGYHGSLLDNRTSNSEKINLDTYFSSMLTNLLAATPVTIQNKIFNDPVYNPKTNDSIAPDAKFSLDNNSELTRLLRNKQGDGIHEVSLKGPADLIRLI